MKNMFFLVLFQLGLFSQEVVLFTQPKSGTHLIIPILMELTEKKVYWAHEYNREGDSCDKSYQELCNQEGYYFFSFRDYYWSKERMDLVWDVNQNNNTFLHLHAPYSLAMENYLLQKDAVTFFLKRDPRDQVVSLLNHYKNISWNDPEVQKLQNDKERLLYMIRKDMRLQTIGFMRWMVSPVCCVLDFEKLMGEHGGAATQEDAIGELRKIAEVLQMHDLSDEQLLSIYQKHFGHGYSFFKGKVGTWKDYLDQDLRIAVKEEVGELLIELGYEKDLDW